MLLEKLQTETVVVAIRKASDFSFGNGLFVVSLTFYSSSVKPGVQKYF